MENERVLEQIRQADMVLAGLGEEFDGLRMLRQNAAYMDGKAILEGRGLAWLAPAWNQFCLKKLGNGREEAALEKLAGLLEEKNFFLVSVAMDDGIRRIPWKGGRLVTPCGSTGKKQCPHGCREALQEVTEEDEGRLLRFFERLQAGNLPKEAASLYGACPKCGAPLVLNNVYAENYDEDGYLEQWRIYTKWLQGTLNRRLFIMELGVGMGFPSVIRWPFERIAFLNQKACFCRVHEKLYQMDEKLSGKGCGISRNAIDWLNQL